MLIAFFAAVIGTCVTQELTPGEPYKEWLFECDKDHFLGGFLAKKAGNDHKMTMFCRKVSERTDASVDVDEGECAWKDPFSLGLETFTFEQNSDQKSGLKNDYNCLEGQYAQALRGRWEFGQRTLQIRCCKPKNTFIHWGFGCHTTNRTQGNLFKHVTAGAKSPYEPRQDFQCPRYVLTGIEVCADGISLKFCPMGINGVTYYDIGCDQLQTTSVEKHACPAFAKPTQYCPVKPYKEHVCTTKKAECANDVDCVAGGHGPDSVCCWNYCENVCFAKIPCTQYKCFDSSYCPHDCWHKCNEWHSGAFTRNQFVDRLIGWECSTTRNDTSFLYDEAERGADETGTVRSARNKRHLQPRCCCKYAYSYPYCLLDGEDPYLDPSYAKRLGLQSLADTFGGGQ